MAGAEYYRKMAEEAERTALGLREPMRSELLELAEKWRRLAEIADARDEGETPEGEDEGDRGP